jgi:hypothetical protein
VEEGVKGAREVRKEGRETGRGRGGKESEGGREGMCACVCMCKQTSDSVEGR